MGNKVIIKKTLQAGSSGKTFWRSVGVVAKFSVLLFLVWGILSMMDDWFNIIGGLIMIPMLLRYMWSHVPGRTIAIISNQGVAVRESKLNVVPWKNIHVVDTIEVETQTGSYTEVRIIFTNRNRKRVNHISTQCSPTIPHVKLSK